MSPTYRLGFGLRGLAIMAVFLGTSELFVRLDDWLTWHAPLLTPYNNDRLLIRDSLGVRGRPSYRYEKWRMNNEGFRGSDITISPPPGRIRVAVLGASETFGLYESYGHEYPVRMQALIDSLAPGRFEVINVALPGMSLSTMVPYYRNAVARIQPSFVFLYPSPSFYLEVKPLAAVYTPPRGAAPARTGRWGLEPGAFESRLAARGRDVLKELIPPRVVSAFREWKLERLRAAHERGWVWQSVPSDRMAILEEHLEQLVPTVQESGARMILVTHTNRFVGLSEPVTGPDRRHLVNLGSNYYPRASDHVLIAVDSAANTIIRTVARRHGADVVEAEGRVPPGGKYFADYAHFTDAGAEVIARILVTELLRLQQGGDSMSVGHASTRLRAQ